MTDPTPIAADPHVSGGVEVTRACRFDGIDYSEQDLQIAQRAACAIVPRYGIGDHGETSAARTGRLWNDHPAVQGALRALHEARLAATPVPANAEGVTCNDHLQVHAEGQVTALKVGRAIEAAWNGSGSEGKPNRLPCIDMSDHECRHVGNAALAALTTRPTDTAAREAAVEAASDGDNNKGTPDETGWLIEHGATSRALYWTGESWGTWNGDLLRACRFARREDASRVARALCDSARIADHGGHRVAEHAWINTPAHIADAGEGDTAALDEGHSCPACPSGPRDIGAVLHNLVGQLRRGGSVLDARSERKLKEAEESLARWQPVVDAHFAALDAAPETTHDR